MDDIVRQFRDGLMRKVVGPSSSASEPASSISGRNLSWTEDEINKLIFRQHTMESANSVSDNKEGDKDASHGGEETESGAQSNGWHSDTELNSKEFPPRVVKRDEEFRSLDSEEKHNSKVQSESISIHGFPGGKIELEYHQRRQVFWISKQILQLMMEDAIDDWLLRQIHWLRRDDVIAQGIRWVQDVYVENVIDANENPIWTCPVCRGICNCSRCHGKKDGNLLVLCNGRKAWVQICGTLSHSNQALTKNPRRPNGRKSKIMRRDHCHLEMENLSRPMGLKR